MQIGNGLGEEIRTGLKDFGIAWEPGYYVIMQLKEGKRGRVDGATRLLKIFTCC
jgi:hypothetical protein